MKNVMNTIVRVATTAVSTLFVTVSAAPGADGELADTAVLHRLFHSLDDVVARLEEAEPATAMGEVVHVVRHLVREAVHLVDERRDDKRGEPADGGERNEERDPGGEPTALDAVPLHPLDRRVERECEEERDQEPAEDVPRDPEDVEDDADRQDDAEDREDRARPEVDDPVDSHVGEFRPCRRLPLARLSA